MPLRLQDAGRAQSLPARGAWIEINSLKFLSLLQQSLPARGAWIEITIEEIATKWIKSLPARGAWIEMSMQGNQPDNGNVAPRTGSVD